MIAITVKNDITKFVDIDLRMRRKKRAVKSVSEHFHSTATVVVPVTALLVAAVLRT